MQRSPHRALWLCDEAVDGGRVDELLHHPAAGLLSAGGAQREAEPVGLGIATDDDALAAVVVRSLEDDAVAVAELRVGDLVEEPGPRHERLRGILLLRGQRG